MSFREVILIHFDTNITNVYQVDDNRLKLIKKYTIFFNETYVNGEMLDKFQKFFQLYEKEIGTFDNQRTRIYATGIFQELSQDQQVQLMIYFYVNFGLVFNIIQPDLELFYKSKSVEKQGEENLIMGLIIQEFRNVVICGSFQQHIDEIKKLIDVCKENNIEVLSPWTTEIVPESMGTDFILLEGQTLLNERDAWRHKYDHMKKFTKADAIIICNPDGIVGKGTMFEFGFMIANSKRIIFTHEPIGLTIKFPYEIGLNFI